MRQGAEETSLSLCRSYQDHCSLAPTPQYTMAQARLPPLNPWTAAPQQGAATALPHEHHWHTLTCTIRPALCSTPGCPGTA